MERCVVRLADGERASVLRAALALGGVECAADDAVDAVLVTDARLAGDERYAAVLMLGEDIPLPVSYPALLAAVRAAGGGDVRRRVHSPAETDESPMLEGGVFVWRGRRVTLSAREAACLAVLLSHREAVVSRETIAEAVWGETRSSNVVDVYVGYLRKKLAPLLGEGVIVAVRGRGYMLRLGG